MSDGFSGLDSGLTSLPIAAGDCWNRIGTSGDRSCPELETHIHCRNCPVFASAARTFFDRPAPEGYLAEWTQWLAGSPEAGNGEAGTGADLSDRDLVSVLIFRLGQEWLAFRTQTVAEVTLPRPVHRIPHRSNEIFIGLVNLRGQLQLCISLHGLLGVEPPQSSPSQFHAHGSNTETEKPAATGSSPASGSRSSSCAIASDRRAGSSRPRRCWASIGFPAPRCAASPRPWPTRKSASARRSSPGKIEASVSLTNSGSSPRCGVSGNERRPERFLDDGPVPHGGGRAAGGAVAGPGGAGGHWCDGRGDRALDAHGALAERRGADRGSGHRRCRWRTQWKTAWSRRRKARSGWSRRTSTRCWAVWTCWCRSRRFRRESRSRGSRRMLTRSKDSWPTWPPSRRDKPSEARPRHPLPPLCRSRNHGSMLKLKLRFNPGLNPSPKHPRKSRRRSRHLRRRHCPVLVPPLGNRPTGLCE